jgi:bifunctional non-homologous end joining protein LigD
LNGEDLASRPQIERKDRLAKIVGTKGIIRYSEHFQGGGEKMLRAFCDAGLEGVVSKRADARYMGARSKAWLKTKCIRRQEFRGGRLDALRYGAGISIADSWRE